MYKVLAPSIITILMVLWRLWTHLCVRGWLSVKSYPILVSGKFVQFSQRVNERGGGGGGGGEVQCVQVI